MISLPVYFCERNVYKITESSSLSINISNSFLILPDWLLKFLLQTQNFVPNVNIFYKFLTLFLPFFLQRHIQGSQTTTNPHSLNLKIKMIHINIFICQRFVLPQ